MGLTEKIANAKKTNWVVEGLSEVEIKTTVELAKISARIERCRLDLGMTQREFADYMGVSQGMVSKWESREYNFTIKSLNEICEKLNLAMTVAIDKPCTKENYIVVKWDEEKFINKNQKSNWIKYCELEGAIA